MYKPTIWQDHVEGIQEGTDMNAANFNNLEIGTMEASALAALNAAYRRYCTDMALNAETIVVKATLTGSGTTTTVEIPEKYKRNKSEYNVVPVVVYTSGGNAGDIIILYRAPDYKKTNQFSVKYTGTATTVEVDFLISGGMI